VLYWVASREEMVMSATVSIEIPREVVHVARMTPEELRQELAAYLFQQGKLSFGKARELAGMTVWAFQLFLGSHDIPVHYDVEDYEQDIDTLKEREERCPSQFAFPDTPAASWHAGGSVRTRSLKQFVHHLAACRAWPTGMPPGFPLWS
jgi:predicted HTH domain antitoxin